MGVLNLTWARGGRTRRGGRLALLVPAVALITVSAARSSLAQSAASATPASADEVVYQSGLRSGWQDWGWGAHELGATARIDFAHYGGWILHHEPRAARYGAVKFRMRAPGSFGFFLELRLANGQADDSFPAVAVGPERAARAPDGWLEVSVPWSLLAPSPAAFDRIVLHAKDDVGPGWVEFDSLRLTSFDGGGTAGGASNSASRRATASVDCRSKGHAISPYIYGVVGDTWDLAATARRWGGNPTSRYNWQLGAHNTGKDWFFENVSAADYRRFLTDNLAHHTASALTVPMIGWVAKDRVSSGYPRTLYGPQRAEDQYRSGSGDGVRPDGTLIRARSPLQTSVESTPAMIGKWVETIREQDRKAGTRSVQLYFLDNEPNLWNSTHRDVHPDPLSYDELLDRTVRYGSSIRAADPQAVIAGPAEWGWTGYFYSAADALAGVKLRPDRRAHGDVPLIPWYLKSLREHEQKTGTKLLDVLDVHFYPQAPAVYSDAADPKTAALRLRSTRALWDPTYTDESWINDNVRLIPRLKTWIADNYPGLKLSIGEYNFGGERDMSGALALAEALGRFGTEGVDYAFYWLTPPKNSPAYWAFRSYRDFDGKGARFLDHSLPARADAGLSLFASRDESGKHLVLIALNLDPQTSAVTKIDLAGCGVPVERRRFSYAAGMSSIASLNTADAPGVKRAMLSETLAPYSITVFDIQLK